MLNTLETALVTLEVNDDPLSLYNDLGRPNLRMISWSRFLTPPLPSQSRWESLIHLVNVSMMTNRYLYP